jgi:poly(A) polymerase
LKAPVPGETGLIILPPPEVRTEVDMWRRIFKAYQGSMTPHITIVYPFVPQKIWEASRRATVDTLRNIHPFKVKLRELGAFIHDESVLWLKPEDGDKLLKIRAKIQQIFSTHMPASSLAYVPHLTLGFFKSVQELHKARKTVQKQIEPLEFTVDKIIYAVFIDVGWRIHDHINLV